MSRSDAPSGILTFLIADVRGYTAFTQSQGDEAAARLADKFAEIATEGVQAHGGEVTELRGDEALAVFSSPRAAVRAAVDLQMIFADEAVLTPALPLTVGIGIDAGEAVPVQGGYRGAALNLAARLCSKAAAGEVLVSQGVALLTGATEGIELEPAGSAEMKGLPEPVQVFRARVDRMTMAVPEVAGELPVELDAVMPIVGRESEIRRLRWLWRHARRGAAAVCAIQGPPGIGKTRLAAELAATSARDGAWCRYVRPGAHEPDAADRNGAGASRPGLLVFDDLDMADAAQLSAIADSVARLAGPRLAVLVVEDGTATAEVLTTVRRLAGGDDRVVRPRPLGMDEMLRVAGFYLGESAQVVPRDMLTATGGVPRVVHEQISEWAHAYASRRLGDLATAAASGRSDLRSVESDLAGTVVDLQFVREQAMLFGLGPGRHAPEPTASPYQGLASFDVEDAEVFFGRERLVAEMVSRLAGTNMLAVVGPSGSGKSSALRAGLLPSLASGVLPGSDQWQVALMRPGEHPMRALDRAMWTALPAPVVARLGDGDSDLETVRAQLTSTQRVVVAIDQFEETFTLCRDEQERADFLGALASAAATTDPRLAILVAIRADYYGRCASDPGFADLLANNTVLVGPMSAEEYRRAIVQPVLHVGAAIEPDLADELVAEVLGEPGALPLLSTALVELWEHRDGRTMRRSSYAATGGVRGAVARLAEEVYGRFDHAEQLVARSVMLRLAGPGLGDAVVRRRVALSEFDVDSDPTVRKVVDVLAARRLVTVSEGSAEVAHEALLREWPRLQEWLEEDREGRRLRAHLANSAQEWMARKRDEGELYRGARLSAALDWTTQHTIELNEAEREFVTASQNASHADLHRQQRQNRRLRGLLAGVIVVLVLALVAGAVALVQRHSAQTAARRALARQLGAEAVSAPRIDQAMLLAREGVLLDKSSDTEGTLLATLLRAPALRGTFTMPIQLRPQRLALSADGRRLAVTGNDGQVHVFDTATHKLLPTVLPDWGGVDIQAAGPDFVYDSYHPTNNTVTMQVYDSSTLRLKQSLQFSKFFLNNPTTSNVPCFANTADTRLYCAYTVIDPQSHRDIRGYVESWNLQTGAHQLAPLPTPGVSVAGITRDGRLIMATDDSILTLDGTTLKSLHRVPTALGQGTGALSPDGRTIAFIAGSPFEAAAPAFSLVDTRTGHRTTLAAAHTAPIQVLKFDPTGRLVVSVGDDSRVVVWDSHSGALKETLSGHSGRILSLTFSTDGQKLYTCALDGAIFVWDLGTSARFGRTFTQSAGPAGPLPPFAMAPDGQRFAARTGTGRVGLFSLDTLLATTTLTMPSGKDVTGLAWSASGTLAVSVPNGEVELWSASGTPALVRTLKSSKGEINAMAFSPDGRRLAAVTALQRGSPSSNTPPEGSLELWDAVTGDLVSTAQLASVGTTVARAHDGKRFAAADRNGTVSIFDGSGRLGRKFTNRFNDPSQALAFLPSGQLLAGGYIGIVQRWNVTTGKPVGPAALTEPAPVAQLAVSPDGKRFAVSGGSSGGVKIWNVATMDQFGATFPGGAGAWGNLAYARGGADIVVVYGDNTADVWPVSLSAWMDHACAVAGRNFTSEEWHRYVPGHSYTRTCPSYPAA